MKYFPCLSLHTELSGEVYTDCTLYTTVQFQAVLAWTCPRRSLSEFLTLLLTVHSWAEETVRKIRPSPAPADCQHGAVSDKALILN